MSVTIQITSDNFNNEIADITFYPDTGGTVSYGYNLIPALITTDYPYGNYELYFSANGRTCFSSVEIPTPTPTLTQTPTPTSGSIVNDGMTLFLDADNSSSYPGTGTTWYDLAGSQQNITLFGSPSFTSGTPSYFNFGGTGSGQYGAGTGQVLQSSGYTKSVWFYLNSYTDNNLVSSDTGGHYMFFGGGNKLYSGNDNWAGFPTNFPSVTSFALNTWYNATITFNTTDGMFLYVNGSLDSSYTAIKTGFVGNGSTNIASYSAGGNLLNGRISKVYCYDRSLTSSEVLQNYNAVKSQFGL